MIKKICNLLTILLLSVICVCAFAISACATDKTDPDDEPSQPVTYTVTFKQDGYDDIVKTVEKGATLTDIPVPKDKVGYTVTWNVAEFVGVSENITVTTVETANNYTITYQPGDGTLDATTQTVTYDAEYTLKVPVHQDVTYTFTCWTRADNTSVAQKGTWKIAEDITLTAQYAEPYTVSFVQEGCETIVMKVAEGGSLASDAIPAPQAKEGYTITWEKTDFTNITQNVIVNAIQTANTYKITYSLGANTYATLPVETQEVQYDQNFTLQTPDYQGSAAFYGWYLVDEDGKATDVKAENGKYIWAHDIRVIAKWQEWSDVVN